MGWKDLLLSPGGPRGTRESVRQQFKRSLSGSMQETQVQRRIAATFDTLNLRYRVVKKTYSQDITILESLPFGYLDNDFETERTLAEYVVYQEHPHDADREFVEGAIWEAFGRLMAADDEDALNAKTNLRKAFPNLQEQVLWAGWIDLQSISFKETSFVSSDMTSNEEKTRAEPSDQARIIATRIEHVARSLTSNGDILRTPFLAGYVAGFPNHLEDMHELAGGVMRTMLFDAIWGADEGQRIFQQLQKLAEQDDKQIKRGAGFGIPDGERWFSSITRPTGPDDSLESLRSAIGNGFVDLDRRL